MNKNNTITKDYLENFFKDFKIISDNHFGHQTAFNDFEIIRQTLHTDFSIFEDMMIENINNSNTNSLLHLGDFCINKMNQKKTYSNIKQRSEEITIKNKILIKGNHDKIENDFYKESGWDYIIDQPIIYLDNELIFLENNLDFTGSLIVDLKGKRILFSHFGIFTNDPRYENKYKEQIEYLQKIFELYKCDINIHGHSHSKSTYTKKSFNASVENINFKPISYNEIITTISS